MVANFDRAELDEASAQLLLISESVWHLVLPFTWFLGYDDIFLDTFQTLSLCFKPHLVAEYPDIVLLQSHYIISGTIGLCLQSAHYFFIWL